MQSPQPRRRRLLSDCSDSATDGEEEGSSEGSSPAGPTDELAAAEGSVPFGSSGGGRLVRERTRFSLLHLSSDTPPSQIVSRLNELGEDEWWGEEEEEGGKGNGGSRILSVFRKLSHRLPAARRQRSRSAPVTVRSAVAPPARKAATDTNSVATATSGLRARMSASKSPLRLASNSGFSLFASSSPATECPQPISSSASRKVVLGAFASLTAPRHALSCKSLPH